VTRSRYLLAALFALAALEAARASGLDEAGAAMIAAQHGEYDEAIRRFGAAIAAGDLSPQNLLLAHHNRGNAFQDKGDYRQAIAEYDSALKLKPDYAGSYYARGRARFAMTQFPAASADFARSVELDPKDAYAVLWLHLSRAKGGVADRGEFMANAESFDLAKWPGAVLGLYLGKRTVEQVRAETPKGDEDAQKEQACEATFYIGEYQLLRRNLAAAKPLFQEALKICSYTTDEYDGAAFELKGLK
jgi:lipoprotein NlpI